MSTKEFIEAERNIDNNMNHYFNILADSSSSLLINIKKFFYNGNITIIYVYKLSKNEMNEILNKNHPNKQILEILYINQNNNAINNYLNTLTIENFDNLFKKYLYSINYELSTEVKDKNEKISYKEILYSDKLQISYNSYIFKNNNFIGFGLFDNEYKNYYRIIINDENLFESSIHKNNIF